ncbi:MAG: ATP-binding protein [Bacteroidales bacterium]|nr:ATP-binding protein [Bacteroidales bacterium]
MEFIERDITQKLLAWKNEHDRKPLIVRGARQIGKSWAVEDFGKRYYEHFAVFNFDRRRELAEVFEKTKDPLRIIHELTFFTEVPLLPEKTLIFFDEIQECKEALNALKYFCEDAPEYHIIAAGSLLGVAINEGNYSFPVGKVTFLQMYPVSFKEYLRAADSILFGQLTEFAGKLEPLPTIVFNRAEEQYHAYQVCGGLPLSARSMIGGNGIETVEKVLEDNLMAYEIDFSKHTLQADIPRIHAIWKSTPEQLSRENNKFVYRVVREGARAREYENALQWLVDSGMIYQVKLCEKPELPLSFYENSSAFKVYMLDIALLRKLAKLPAEIFVSSSNLFTEFKGALAENFVLTSLLAQGFGVPNYWTLQGNKAEVDFLVANGLTVIPIEVKSDRRISGKSFAEYDKKYHPSLRIRFSMNNIKKDGNLLNLPIFMADWVGSYLN